MNNSQVVEVNIFKDILLNLLMVTDKLEIENIGEITPNKTLLAL